MAAGTSAATGRELAVCKRDQLDTRGRAVLGLEVSAVEAHARFGVDQVGPEACCEGALDLEARGAR
jgi:hypothetical protein